MAQRDDPALRGKPVVVGSWVVHGGQLRGARVRRARRDGRGSRAASVPGARRRRLELDAYVEASRAVFAIFERHVPVVEPGVDGGGVPRRERSGEPAVDVAVRLRREVREEVGLPLSVGVARTKVLAKMASRSAKPDGLFVVEPGARARVPAPARGRARVGRRPGEREQAARARAATVGEVAQLGEGELMAILGKAAGRYVHAIARNHDQRPVRRRRGRRSIGSQRALRPGPHPRAELDEAIAGLAERVTSRMQRKARAGRTVVLRLRFGDYTRATARARSRTRPPPGPIAAALGELLDGAMPVIEARGITLVGITVTNLDDSSAHQLALPLPDSPP